MSSGERWVTCGQGHTHWGAHGAAGLLISHTPAGGPARYLLHCRSDAEQHSGTWSTPGGALREGEPPEQGALREATDELGELHPDLAYVATHADEHGGWTYWTVEMDAPEPFEPGGAGATSWETAGHAWLTAEEVEGLPLHPGFAASWPALSARGMEAG